MRHPKFWATFGVMCLLGGCCELWERITTTDEEREAIAKAIPSRYQQPVEHAEQLARQQKLSRKDVGVLDSLWIQLSDLQADNLKEQKYWNRGQKNLHLRLDTLLPAMEMRLQEVMPVLMTSAYKRDDVLLQGREECAVYVERGEKLAIRFHSEKPATIKVYNFDEKQLLKTYTDVKDLDEDILVPHRAIYLVEFWPQGKQYITAEVGYMTSTTERFLRPTKLRADIIPAKKGEFHTYLQTDIQMKNVFKEPRRFTLRGQLKAAFSGASRAIVSIPIPQSATDIMYSLRISTSERDRSSDGQFNNNLAASYNKVKLFGIPVYESQRSGLSSLFTSLLDDNRPLREEDAYCNMYVFKNGEQAKRFQDGAAAGTLQYDIDYSTLGTQSCNGWIPTKGRSTIYLGFENERMRYLNYIWLEVVAVTPHTQYYTTVYRIDE